MTPKQEYQLVTWMLAAAALLVILLSLLWSGCPPELAGFHQVDGESYEPPRYGAVVITFKPIGGADAAHDAR